MERLGEVKIATSRYRVGNMECLGLYYNLRTMYKFTQFSIGIVESNRLITTNSHYRIKPRR